MLKSQSLVVYLKLYRKEVKILTQPKLDNNIMGVITQFQLKIPIFFGYVLNFPRVSKFVPMLL